MDQGCKSVQGWGTALRVALFLLLLGATPLAAVMNPILVHLGATGSELIEGDLDFDQDVDLDDFFILSDLFGSKLGETNFDKRVDFVDNNIIDIEDFFAMADKFGQVGDGATTELGGTPDRQEIGFSTFKRPEGVVGSLLGDLDLDLDVDLDDFFRFADGYGLSRGEPGFNEQSDLSGDGIIDLNDYAVYFANFQFFSRTPFENPADALDKILGDPALFDDPESVDGDIVVAGPIPNQPLFLVFNIRERFPELILDVPAGSSSSSGSGSSSGGSASSGSGSSSGGGSSSGSGSSSGGVYVAEKRTGVAVNDPLGIDGISLSGEQYDENLNIPLAGPSVPEPSSVVLLLTGLVGLGGYCWRRKSRQ